MRMTDCRAHAQAGIQGLSAQVPRSLAPHRYRRRLCRHGSNLCGGSGGSEEKKERICCSPPPHFETLKLPLLGAIIVFFLSDRAVTEPQLVPLGFRPWSRKFFWCFRPTSGVFLHKFCTPHDPLCNKPHIPFPFYCPHTLRLVPLTRHRGLNIEPFDLHPM